MIIRSLVTTFLVIWEVWFITTHRGLKPSDDIFLWLLAVIGLFISLLGIMDLLYDFKKD